MRFELGYGNTFKSVDIAKERILDIVEGRPFAPMGDIGEALIEAIEHPIGSAPLREIVKPNETVCIVVSDVTRGWVRYDAFLPVLLDYINELGVPDSNIKLLVAYGAHRLQSEEESCRIYGNDVLDRVVLYHSSGINPESTYRRVGTTTRGVPIELNEIALDADRVILTGGIVYHLMAGFGGGRKGVLPGISSYQAIQKNHTLCLSNEIGGGLYDHIESGELALNRMHQDQLEHAKALNADFLINVVQNPEGQLAKFVAGHWHDAWKQGTEMIHDIFGVPVKGRADCVIASAGGYPRDINLYQGIKTQDNAVKACRKGGVVILVLELEDIGEPIDFMQWFDYETIHDHEIALRKAFTVPGFVSLCLRYGMETYHHILVTEEKNREVANKVGISMVTSIDEALDEARRILGNDEYSITIMPQGAATMPIIE